MESLPPAALGCVLVAGSLVTAGWLAGRGSRLRAVLCALRPRRRRDRTRETFVFADLEGFSGLAETFGDEHAADLAERFRLGVDELRCRHRAEIVKSLGDGLMLRATDPAAGVRLAVATAAEVGGQWGLPAIRVGVHTGPAVKRGSDWFGTTVNVAARVSALARGGQVLVTQAVREAAGGAREVEFGEPVERHLRNLSAPVTFFEARRRGAPGPAIAFEARGDLAVA